MHMDDHAYLNSTIDVNMYTAMVCFPVPLNKRRYAYPMFLPAIIMTEYCLLPLSLTLIIPVLTAHKLLVDCVNDKPNTIFIPVRVLHTGTELVT